MQDEDAWYVSLRERWRPEQVRLLLIAESAPDDGGVPSNRRFFYSERLTRDNLFRSVVLALYGITSDELKSVGKSALLQRLVDDGVFLIDLVPFPVNALSGSERFRALRANVAGCVERARMLDPDGVVVVKKDVFRLLAEPLRAAGLPLLHSEGISFPLGNTRAEFVRDFTAAVGRLEPNPPVE